MKKTKIASERLVQTASPLPKVKKKKPANNYRCRVLSPNSLVQIGLNQSRGLRRSCAHTLLDRYGTHGISWVKPIPSKNYTQKICELQENQGETHVNKVRYYFFGD